MKSCIEELTTVPSFNFMGVVTFVNGARYLHFILPSTCRTIESPFVNLTAQSIFEVTAFFDCLSVINNSLWRKTPTVLQDYSRETLVGFCVQNLVKSWKNLFSR